MANDFVIKVTKGGPYIITGKLKLVLPSGEEKEQSGTTALCRCGHSKNKPFCDGSHMKYEFDE